MGQQAEENTLSLNMRFWLGNLRETD